MMVMKGLESIQLDLNKINTEIEDLRSTLNEMELVHPDVLKISWKLDQKIIGFIILQQAVQGRRDQCD